MENKKLTIEEEMRLFMEGLKQSEAERKKSEAAFNRRMENIEKKYGSITNNQGMITEYFFANAFIDGKKNFFGEEFDEIICNMVGDVTDSEYDVVMINGKSVCIIECKYKAYEKDVRRVLNKPKSFRINFPEYENHKIFLGLASKAFYPEIIDECEKNGIAVIKESGDNVSINYKHLKEY